VLAPVLGVLAVGSGGLLSEVVFERLVLRDVPLEEVAVLGAWTLSPEDIAARAGVEPGQPLSSIGPEQVRAALAGEPWIASARVLRLPSGVLVIGVVEREAVARWRVDGRDGTELIDRRGERFAGRPDPRRPLPLVQGAGPVPTRIDEETRALLDELMRHPGLATRAESVTIRLPGESSEAESGEVRGDEDGYVIQIGESGPRALLGRRRLRQRVARLAVLLESEETPIADARWIDLRYADQAVLRTEPVPG
jgi:cell division septal protein FtsQ